MNALSYFVSTLLCFGGLFFGMVLALVAKEELRPGKRYFLGAQKALFGLIGGLVMYSLTQNMLAALLTLIAMFFVVRFVHPKNNVVYSSLGIALFMSYNSGFFVVVCSLVLLYGTVLGTLFTKDVLRKNKLAIVKEILIKYIGFLAVAALGYLLMFI